MATNPKTAPARRKRKVNKTVKSVKRNVIYLNNPVIAEAISLSGIALAILMVLSVYTQNMAGFVGAGIDTLLRGLFGFGAYILPFIILGFCIYTLFFRENPIGGAKIGQASALFVCVICLVHIINSAAPGDYGGAINFTVKTFEAGSIQNGGLIGAALGDTLIKIVGKVGAYVIIVAAVVVLGVLLTGRSLQTALRAVYEKFHDVIGSIEFVNDAPETDEVEQPERPVRAARAAAPPPVAPGAKRMKGKDGATILIEPKEQKSGDEKILLYNDDLKKSAAAKQTNVLDFTPRSRRKDDGATASGAGAPGAVLPGMEIPRMGVPGAGVPMSADAELAAIIAEAGASGAARAPEPEPQIRLRGLFADETEKPAAEEPPFIPREEIFVSSPTFAAERLAAEQSAAERFTAEKAVAELMASDRDGIERGAGERGAGERGVAERTATEWLPEDYPAMPYAPASKKPYTSVAKAPVIPITPYEPDDLPDWNGSDEKDSTTIIKGYVDSPDSPAEPDDMPWRTDDEWSDEQESGRGVGAGSLLSGTSLSGASPRSASLAGESYNNDLDESDDYADTDEDTDIDDTTDYDDPAETPSASSQKPTSLVKCEPPDPNYKFPPIEMLSRNTNVPTAASRAQILENSRKLEETLRSFSVEAKVVEVSKGPTVTRYELSPGQGVKVSKISSLAGDLALNLAAVSIRIEAPIPGKAAVGIEIPNKETTPVLLREVLEDEAFRTYPSKVAFGLGKDIAGNTVVTDIARMPHLLIAGATGSGKSVCINTLITSILYKARPNEVKLLMIDPKIVELCVYNGIPHLLIPVVTDPKKASAALNWACAEMDIRYKMFAEYSVRDLKGYNAHKAEAGETDFMPQIVIIIDELADLMMTAPGVVEEAICRLAQKARACGIHLIIATQRPSVDVITGLIKANVPSRLAFAVSSGTDSRTVLDMVGAEKLLGKGDMLFSPVGMGKPLRIQGAFISDKEREDIVGFLKAQHKTEYDKDFINKITSGGKGSDVSGGDVDEFFDEAVEFLIQKEKASASMLQRQFRIGYNRASRLIEDLETRGIVGEEDGSKPRKVLINRAQWRQMKRSRDNSQNKET